MANSKSAKKNSKKVVVDYSKKEKAKKEFLLYDTSLFTPDLDDTIDEKKIISVVKKYGKSYYKVQNI